jgi:hypothetical protein
MESITPTTPDKPQLVLTLIATVACFRVARRSLGAADQRDGVENGEQGPAKHALDYADESPVEKWETPV